MDYLLPYTPGAERALDNIGAAARQAVKVPRPARLFPLLAALLTLAGCSLAPSYQPPVVATPAAFKEAPAEGQWKTAEPAENSPRGEWW